MPIIVSNVAPGSTAEAAGILKGSSVRSVNGIKMRDPIDFMFASSDAVLDISYSGPDRTLHEARIVRKLGESIGLSFAPITPRVCPNKCIFCFLDQMPKGLRPSLLIRDDDYRLSFLFGNFITATNLSAADLERIEHLHLSPLYISVHATDPEVRARMLGNANAPPILPALEELADAGITLHTQIVLCPGINDENVLEQTIFDLAPLFPSVATIAIVPIGLTRFRAHLPKIEPVSPEYAARLIQKIRPLQTRFAAELGAHILFLSDEFYLMAGAILPDASEYGTFEQIENGVGITSRFMAEMDEALSDIGRCEAASRPDGVVVTGKLAAPVMSEATERLNRALGTRLEVLSMINRFFGDGVTVAGLLVGQDIEGAIARAGLASGQVVLIPDVALEGESEEHKGDRRRFIDGMTLGELKQKTGATLVAAPVGGSEFTRFLQDYFAPLINPRR